MESPTPDNSLPTEAAQSYPKGVTMFQFLPLFLFIGEMASKGQGQGQLSPAAKRGPVCPSCHDSDTAGCHTLVSCQVDEECYTQKYINELGVLRFRSGCEKKSVCAALSKRDVSGPVVCEACCDSIGCISDRCGSLLFRPVGLACFSCANVSDPVECKAARYCYDRYQKCLTYEYRVPLTNKVTYFMGCAASKRCEVLEQQGAQTHTNQQEKWYNQTCCDKSFCNQFGATDHLPLPSNNSTSLIIG